MKQIILITIIFMFCVNCEAQTAALTVVNTTSCDHKVTVYAMAPSISAPNCGDIVSDFFIVPAGTTFSWTDPCDFELGACYDPSCSSGCTCPPVGWAAIPSSVCSTYPTDFEWMYALVDYVGISCPCTNRVAGIVGNACGGGSNPLSGCGGTAGASWSATGGPNADITIAIYP